MPSDNAITDTRRRLARLAGLACAPDSDIPDYENDAAAAEALAVHAVNKIVGPGHVAWFTVEYRHETTTNVPIWTVEFGVGLIPKRYISRSPDKAKACCSTLYKLTEHEELMRELFPE